MNSKSILAAFLFCCIILAPLSAVSAEPDDHAVLQNNQAAGLKPDRHTTLPDNLAAESEANNLAAESDTDDNATRPDSQTILASLAAKARQTKTLESSFRQVRYISFMDEELVSEGFFSFHSPNELIWQYDKPAFFRLTYKDGEASFSSDVSGKPSGNAQEAVLAARMAENILPWITLDLERIQADFSIEMQKTSPLTLRLTPKQPDSAYALKEMQIEFAGQGPEVSVITLHDADNDYTRLTFLNSIRHE